MEGDNVDAVLLERFEREIWSKVPHVRARDDNNNNDNNNGNTEIVGATPLVDITAYIRECMRTVYNIDVGPELQIMGKMDSELPTGSIKVRPAVNIIHNAILSGKLRTGQTVIEATSGNFGIALGLLARLGINVITLVSRRLQEGVFEELRNENVHIIDLDMDVCPAPGMQGNKDEIAARAAAANIRSQLAGVGFATETFDASMDRILELLMAQDIIELAKFLSEIYGCFCPAQYENSLNPMMHRTVTAVEVDRQLQGGVAGANLGDYNVVCAFGTGGTSMGFHEYAHSTYEKSLVHLVFPPVGQDVAGIRTQATADGLPLYRPDMYAGEHIIDFEKVKPMLRFLVMERGLDIGESSALALYAAVKMAVQGTITSKKFVVIIADGITKYKKAMMEDANKGRIRVSLEDAAASAAEYDRIVWVHPQYTPREAGIEVIARSLGVDKSRILVQKASTVKQLLTTQQVPEEMSRDLKDGKCLMICMAGNTSFMATKVLARSGIAAESLNGGITGLPEGRMQNPGALVQVARE